MADNIRTVEHATCTFCGCVCDDMNLTVDLDRHVITKAENACILGKAWFVYWPPSKWHPLSIVPSWGKGWTP